MDDSDNEAYVFFGTRLPDPEEEPARKKTLTGALKQGKHVPYEEQAVIDEKGRPVRFHGAFTGGFSAGYFNTVGSKEGWTPSVFVSSRSTRGDRKQQRPEDYMDTEDLSEFGIAPQRVVTRRDFANDTEFVSRFVDFGRTIIPEGDKLLKEMVIPAKATVGVRLLRKMGYRESGRVQKKTVERSRRLVGCSMGPLREGESDEADDEGPIVFRKKDLNPMRLASHDNQFGLGYRSLRDSVVSTSAQSAPLRPAAAKSANESRHQRALIKGAAFGVGVLNEDDEDFEDVYDHERMDKYDFAIGSHGASDSDSQDEKAKRRQSRKEPSGQTDTDLRMAVLVEGFERARLADNESSRRAAALCATPPLPANYTPKRPFEQPLPAASTATTSTAAKSYNNVESKIKSQKASVQNAQTRATLLGDGEKRKADVFMSDRQVRFDTYCAAVKRQESEPYNDVLKQFAYLKERTEWEIAEEREQFARRYTAYVKPIHDLLRNRFISSGALDSQQVSKSSKEPATSSNVFKVGQKVQRSVVEWRPVRLLCKRFNVPAPFPDDDNPTGNASAEVNCPNRTASTSAAANEQRVGKQLEQLRFLFDDLKRRTESETDESKSLNQPAQQSQDTSTPISNASENADVETVTKQTETTKPKSTIASLFDALDEEAEESEDAASRRAQNTSEKLGEKPPVDLFKAIFTDSESDGDNDDSANSDVVDEQTAATSTMQSRKRSPETSTFDTRPSATHAPPSDSDEDAYGPAPPPSHQRIAGDADELMLLQKERQQALQRTIASIDASARAQFAQQQVEFVEKTIVSDKKPKHKRARSRSQSQSSKRSHKHKSKRREHGRSRRSRSRSRSRHDKHRKRSSGYDASDSDA